MYARFFGLERDAFSIAPDPRYLFMSERHREALAHLLYGLDGGGGFVLLTGEIGTGKTTVCRCFLEQVPPHCNVAYLFNPRLNALELLQSICGEFGVEAPAADAGPGAPASSSLRDGIESLNRFLLDAHAQGRTSVLVVDEAQNLSAEVLEQLRLLTNLETSEKKLLQIVLIGQPELRELLARPELEQLAQRVVARYHLGPLGAAETAQYLAHRLAVAGLVGPLPFEPAAVRRIHALTGGVPRRINLLAGRALLGAYALGAHRIDGRIVTRAAREVFMPPRSKRKRRSIALGLAQARERLGAPGSTGTAPSRLAGLLVAAVILLGVVLVIDVVARTGLLGSLRGRWHAPIASRIAGYVGLHPDGKGDGPVPKTAIGAQGSGSGSNSDGQLAAAGTGSSTANASASGNAANTSSGAASGAAALAASPVQAAAPLDAAGLADFVERLPLSEDAAWRALAVRWQEAAPLSAGAAAAEHAESAGGVTGKEAGGETPAQEKRPSAASGRAEAPVEGDACTALAGQGLRCFEMPRAALPVLRQLDRPGIVALRRGPLAPGAATEPPVAYALLVGLDADDAVLAVPGDARSAARVPLDLLTTRWRGAFDTLWRVTSLPGDGGAPAAADRAALAAQLASAGAASSSASSSVSGASGAPVRPATSAPSADEREQIYRFQLAHGLTPDGLAGPLTRMQLNRATGVAEPRLMPSGAR